MMSRLPVKFQTKFTNSSATYTITEAQSQTGEIRDDKAMDWLADNVSERDALNWEYEIIDFNEEEYNG